MGILIWNFPPRPSVGKSCFHGGFSLLFPWKGEGGNGKSIPLAGVWEDPGIWGESQESREDSSTSDSQGIRAAKIPGKQHLRDLVLADLVEAELGEVQDLLPVILRLPGDQQIRDLWEKREWEPRELPENPRKAELVPSFPV